VFAYVRACAWYSVAWQSVIRVGEGGGAVFEGIDRTEWFGTAETRSQASCMYWHDLYASSHEWQTAYAEYSRYCAGLPAPAKSVHTAQSTGDSWPSWGSLQF
jgi:hypothetical protein